MLKALAKIFGSKPKARNREHQDAVLGTLRLAEEDWWEASVMIDDRALGFKIGGDREPDAALIEHARDIVRTFPEFSKMINEFLASEASRMPGAAG